MVLKKGFLVKSAEWLEVNHLSIAENVGPIILALMCVWIGVWLPDELDVFEEGDHNAFLFWLSRWTPWLFVVVSVVAIYGGVVGAKNSRHKERIISQLKEEGREIPHLRESLEEAQQAVDYQRIQYEKLVYDAVSDFLGHLLNDHLSFNDSERASIYLYYENSFILAGRYSKNVELRKPNRTKFSIGEGCIGHTWDNGGEFFKELPLDEGDYFQVLKDELAMDKGKVRKLRMKSRAYCSFALEEGYRRVGVILFESIQHGVLDQGALQDIVSNHSSYMIEMLKKTKDASGLVKYQNGEKV